MKRHLSRILALVLALSLLAAGCAKRDEGNSLTALLPMPGQTEEEPTPAPEIPEQPAEQPAAPAPAPQQPSEAPAATELPTQIGIAANAAQRMAAQATAEYLAFVGCSEECRAYAERVSGAVGAEAEAFYSEDLEAILLQLADGEMPDGYSPAMQTQLYCNLPMILVGQSGPQPLIAMNFTARTEYIRLEQPDGGPAAVLLRYAADEGELLLWANLLPLYDGVWMLTVSDVTAAAETIEERFQGLMQFADRDAVRHAAQTAAALEMSIDPAQGMANAGWYADRAKELLQCVKAKEDEAEQIVAAYTEDAEIRAMAEHICDALDAPAKAYVFSDIDWDAGMEQLSSEVDLDTAIRQFGAGQVMALLSRSIMQRFAGSSAAYAAANAMFGTVVNICAEPELRVRALPQDWRDTVIVVLEYAGARLAVTFYDCGNGFLSAFVTVLPDGEALEWLAENGVFCGGDPLPTGIHQFFDDSCWTIVIDQMRGARFYAKFYEDETFEVKEEIGGEVCAGGSYVWMDGGLVLTVESGDPSVAFNGVEFVETDEGFRSVEQFPMQMGWGYLKILPDPERGFEQTPSRPVVSPDGSMTAEDMVAQIRAWYYDFQAVRSRCEVVEEGELTGYWYDGELLCVEWITQDDRMSFYYAPDSGMLYFVYIEETDDSDDQTRVYLWDGMLVQWIDEDQEVHTDGGDELLYRCLDMGEAAHEKMRG